MEIEKVKLVSVGAVGSGMGIRGIVEKLTDIAESRPEIPPMVTHQDSIINQELSEEEIKNLVKVGEELKRNTGIIHLNRAQRREQERQQKKKNKGRRF